MGDREELNTVAGSAVVTEEPGTNGISMHIIHAVNLPGWQSKVVIAGIYFYGIILSRCSSEENPEKADGIAK